MENIWLEAQTNLKQVLTEQTYSTWIDPLKFLGATVDTIVLEVPSSFFQKWVTDKYLAMIKEAISAVNGKSYQIEFHVAEEKPEAAHEAKPEKEAKPAREKERDKDKEKEKDREKEKKELVPNLNPKYTFESFVSGPSNQFAYAASQAVANKPATNYNPLFIYGGVGLGKTHLVNAIGNHILAKNPKAKICYYSSEKFMNEMINSLRYKKMDEFRNKFRKMDLLLIDDIQFMAGKEATQEEFFHTFNALYESHKQIVVTSDKFPKDIPGLEERLRSRFEWGLIADIQPPGVETKVAILKKKSDMHAVNLPDDVALFLAEGANSNIRELEGMLIRLEAFASLTGQEITLSMAREVMKDIIVEKTRDITVEMIQKTVAEHFRIKVSELKSDKRIKTLVVPRQIAIYICRELTKASYPEIGEKFGGKDHSTIIHSVKKIEKQIAGDDEFKATVEDIRKKLFT
ncbi:chromosomal replication initiator protein DnaA [Citrifermentans bemidjiense Bem]|uniref:Chromosomal replication initiator protein DnaA n=1 Tax=Citrifermentans bemidjiense (strain ATCC BAA-1014 / DSM 16622 / JCM 12645 / Bem) TaxID=404380 RepID=DNAA_CITBB|nr:chromosomal replication initiator protein DnaA [Citrifermentans bemidjiense]B5E7P6.1 RecName: Full=Chromosomal replication initiator protein DnaA [Citrifermentans bemidjiense Bem]ACH37034.1 chromosomal replication initiator protein DnaA [Citrifermentans bemidjiense Bem]